VIQSTGLANRASESRSFLRRRALGALGALVAAVVWFAPSARAQVDPAAFQTDLQSLSAPVSRVIGSDGYEQTVAYLRKQINALPGVQLREQSFSVMVPVTRSATLERAGAKSEPIYPFWPAHARANSTPERGITGKLVYCGGATLNEITPAELMGNIAVVEASAGSRWTQASYFGATAVLVLGEESTTNVDLRAHDLNIPVNLPRFYIPDGALAASLRKSEVIVPVTLKARVDWQQKTATNLIALVKPAKRIPDGWKNENVPPGALLVTAPLESSGLVPDLAGGAGQAANTAGAMALLRDFATKPPARPVVVVFTGADSIQFRGTRELLMALSDVPKMWRDRLNGLVGDEDVLENLALARAQTVRLNEVAEDPSLLKPGVERELIDRVTKIIETDLALAQDELFRQRMLPVGKQDPEVVKKIEADQVGLNRLKFVFQTAPADLKLPEVLPIAQEYVKRTLSRLDSDAPGRPGLRQSLEARKAQLESRITLYQWLATEIGRNADPSDRANSSRLIEILVALDLSDRGVRAGPMYFGNFQRSSSISQVQDYRDWFTRIERTGADEKNADGQWFRDLHGAIDLTPMTDGGSRSPSSWIGQNLPIGSEMAQAWGVPGFSFVTLDDLRLLRDTPLDTLSRLDTGAIESQLRATGALLRRAWDDPKLVGVPEWRWVRSSFGGQVVSPAPGRPVPDLPREGFVASYFYVGSTGKGPPRLRPQAYGYTTGIRRVELAPTDAEGRYFFEGLPRLNDSTFAQFGVQVFKFDPTSGAVVSSSDLGKQSGDISMYADIRQSISPLRSIPFDCVEFALVGLYDPRFLQDLGEVIPLDARRNAEPQRYNMVVNRQIMAGFIEPDTRAHLLFRYGRVGNRLVLLNMRDPAEPDVGKMRDTRDAARGFYADALNAIGPLALVTSQDFGRLNGLDLKKYEKAGVTSSLINDLHAESSRQLDAAAISMKSPTGRASDVVRDANGAWANEARVYQAAQDMASDVIHAAIFLLLLCVPFSFCMERLMIGSPNVYRQIAGIFGVFTIMTAALWSFHPAFQISASPLIIILAFAIIFMSLVVIWVVYGKFDTELKRISSGRGSADGASFARAGVMMAAVLLGIANMRKRKFRTGLTSLTIVLITFAVLCFTSSSRYVGTSTLPTGVETSHPGLMLRQRGFRPMPEVVVENLKAVLPGNAQLVERWWNVNAADPKDMVNVVSTGTNVLHTDGGPVDFNKVNTPARVFAAQAVLGLSPGESTVSKIAEVIGAEKFARLEKGEQRIIYLSKQIADQLKVSERDTVNIGGIELQVAGIFDGDEFDQRVTTLSGDPISPLKYSSGALDAGGRNLADNAQESLDLDADSSAAELSGTYEHLSSTQFVIVPASVSRMLPNMSLRSVALKLNDETEVKTWSDVLSRRFAVAMFAGYDDGVRLVASSNLSSVSGAGQVAIPLAIAGLIIFNTMMGSIAERKREIHVYTSLGLAPMHVGALFVAEAMTYGLIGTVFGYVIGQGAGTAMLKLGWLGSVTLNYSGTSAMVTMGLILVIVLLSALVPARLASKLAAPSIDRSWKVPLPKNDEIFAVLPFTINVTAAQGALAYLAEFFDAHKEGSIGKFSAGNVEAFNFTDDKGRTSRGLKTVIWLTPFDLGVRQHLMLLIHPGQFPDIYEVQVILQRLSGDDGSWYRMNRTFLTELRKQFLQWRSLSPQRMLEYVEDSKRLFKGSGDVVTVDGKTTREPPLVVTTPAEDVRIG